VPGLRAALMAALAAGLAAAPAAAMTVPGTANPWLAGMAEGATASRGDSAPRHSPVAVPAQDLAGAALTFSVTGSVSHGGGRAKSPPDGGAPIRHYAGAQNGIAGLRAPIDSLIGVFLGDAGPTGSGVPEELDFRTPGSRDFTTLAPALRQPFFIGDGLTSAGAPQIFVAPEGATRLYLGTMDGFGWYNNTGAFEVETLGGAASSAEGG
jgi:large repetitive protein